MFRSVHTFVPNHRFKGSLSKCLCSFQKVNVKQICCYDIQYNFFFLKYQYQPLKANICWAPGVTIEAKGPVTYQVDT